MTEAPAGRLQRAWDHFWYRPESPAHLTAARIIVSLQTLWLLLSRPDLPELRLWPTAFWANVPPALRVRFFIFDIPFEIERALYLVLALALLLTAFGVGTRIWALVAGLLLYHFAPFEDIFASQGGPFFRGFTLSVVALLIFSFAEKPRRGDGPSPEYRWPVALIQLLFSFTYLFSGLSKLRTVGFAWASAANFEGLVQAMVVPEVRPLLAHWFIGQPLLCAAGGVAGLLLDFGVVAAVFSRRAAAVIVPAALLAHALIYLVMGVFFPAAPLLLLFVDWEGLVARLRALTVFANA
jgi:hypothetical protein